VRERGRSPDPSRFSILTASVGCLPRTRWRSGASRGSASFVGIGMGWVLDHWGWGAWPFVPIPFALAGAAIIAQLWNVTPGKKNTPVEAIAEAEA